MTTLSVGENGFPFTVSIASPKHDVLFVQYDRTGEKIAGRHRQIRESLPFEGSGFVRARYAFDDFHLRSALARFRLVGVTCDEGRSSLGPMMG